MSSTGLPRLVHVGVLSSNFIDVHSFRTAKVYINLYDNHISPGMNLLSDIPPFIDEHDEAGKTNMGLKATEVKEWAAKTQKDMLDVMKKV